MLLLAALALAACSNDSSTVRIDGSSTVFPITEAVAEEFMLATDGVRVNVGFSGTGAGFEKFCRGDTQISAASRAIKDAEVEDCADSGIDDILEIQIAIDALTVMVNPKNDFVDCMTVDELHLAFRHEGASRWSDIRPEWPSDSIIFYYPGTDSGTFDYFLEAIIDGVDETASHRGDGTASEDDNVLALGIENDSDALGYFGFAFFSVAGEGLTPVAVDDGDGECVTPSFESALDGSYTPLSRPLFIYTRESFLRERPEVLSLVRFYLESSDIRLTPEQNLLVPEVGYITMPPDLLDEQYAKLDPFLQIHEDE
ncbi:MAG: PstS family phosphate ABC transporter substrate-binding protein [Chloroflexi bacterium]|nr:PstS family phosphate ABC transporter substrate-binding protein [Chloroflexota bacterium]